jgi:Cof subfamily protein (haloacid dehalogenase superfamily)
MAPPPLPPGFRPGGRFADWRPTVPAYVVADVDGTLLGPSGVVSERVVTAATAAVAAGVAVGFATGRMRGAVEALYERLPLPGPHILHNGAEVRVGGRTVATWPLGRHGLEAVLGIVRKLGVYAEISVDDGYYVTAWDERAQPHWDLLGQRPRGVATSAAEVTGTCVKATFALFDPADLAPVVAAIERAGLRPGPASSPMTPDIQYVNATHPDADKGQALRTAAAHLGVDLAAVAAIGDAVNDLPMFALAGTAIAMGGTPDEVVAGAHLVAPPVEDDGVAAVLEAVIAWREAAGISPAE